MINNSIETLPLTIMVNPLKGFKEILKSNSKFIIPLFLLAGFSQAWQSLSDLPKGSIVWSSVLVTTMIYVLTAWIFYCLFTSVLNYTSKLLGGTGNFKDLLVIFAWSMLPVICVLIGYLLLLPFFGEELFKLRSTEKYIVLYNSLIGVKFLAIIWSTIILLRGVMLIHNLTYGRAALSITIVAVIFSLFRLSIPFFLNLF